VEVRYVVASRGSQLALCQTALAVAKLRLTYDRTQGSLPDFTISTQRAVGDKNREDWALAAKKLPVEALSRKWTFELEKGVSDSDFDLAIHSGKDLSFRPFEHTEIIPILEREDPRDVWIPKDPSMRSLDNLRNSAIVGTNSNRRRANLRVRHPNLRFSDYSGNVTTRILPEQMESAGVDGIVMAAAGLKRLQLFDPQRMFPLNPDFFMPSGNQGILAAQVNINCDPALKEHLLKLRDRRTSLQWYAERGFLEQFEGTCETPISVFASVKEDTEALFLCLRARIPMRSGFEHICVEASRVLEASEDFDVQIQSAREIGRGLAETAHRAGATNATAVQHKIES